MSRIGKKPITVPSGVKVTLEPKARTINVEGPKGKLSYTYRPEVGVAWDEGEHRIICSIAQEQMRVGQMRAYWGTTRAQIQNMIVGVSRGFMKKLDVVGVGWGAKAMGKLIELNVGYCHPVRVPVPEGIEVGVAGTIITISGADRQAVGQLAAKMRSARPPEPYNGKGVKYLDEVIVRKQGKVFGT